MNLTRGFFSWLLLAVIPLVGVLGGCQSAKPGTAITGDAALSIRNNSYSLLHQLLSDEKRVSLLRFIKREEPEVKKLVQRIAVNSATGAKLLEEFARHDRSIRLDDVRLPAGEVAARDAIASTKQHELLGQSGASFELSLLLTQAEALTYAAHLAKVASEHDGQPGRARALAGLSQDMERLYLEIVALLLERGK